MTRLLPFTSVMTTAAAFAALCTGAGVANADGFSQTNLVSNLPGLATATDSSLVNPWGVSFANGSPIWISDQGTQTTPLFSVTGSTGVSQNPVFTVNVPPAGGTLTVNTGFWETPVLPVTEKSGVVCVPWSEIQMGLPFA